MTSDQELFRLAIEEAGSGQLASGNHALVFETAEEFASCFRYVLKKSMTYVHMSDMADCMRMVHGELITLGIIAADTVPMFVAEAVLKHIETVRAKEREYFAGEYARNADAYTGLKADFESAIDWRQKTYERAVAAEADATHWKANHDDQVARAQILLERPDMPLERVNAYKLVCDMAEDFKRFQACRHQARDMIDDGGETAFIEAIDKYRSHFGQE